MSGDGLPQLDDITPVTGIGGGLAQFLYGMRKKSDALKVVAGSYEDLRALQAFEKGYAELAMPPEGRDHATADPPEAG